MKVKNLFKPGKSSDKGRLAGTASTSASSFIGKTIRVGEHSVVIEKSVAEGGYAYVFEARDSATNTVYALKRVVVDDEKLPMIEREIAFLTRVNGHKNIVALKASSIAKIRDGYFEGMILMELCPGRVLDMLAERGGKPLPEAEVLHIFSDVCEGVAHVHSVKPGIVHRDLKIENVLRGADGVFKLCDFGSATESIVRPQGPAIAALEEEIQRYTTVQYRSPEMIDLYSGKVIGLKSDVWALGCLLYKLCFLTTPFEDRTLQILNCKYSVPATNPYSPNMLALIKFMLEIDPYQRPDIFAVANRTLALRFGSPQHQLTPPAAYVEAISREGYGQSAPSTSDSSARAAQPSPQPQHAQQQQQAASSLHAPGQALGRSPAVARAAAAPASPAVDRTGNPSARRERPKGSLPSLQNPNTAGVPLLDVSGPPSAGIGNPWADAHESSRSPAAGQNQPLSTAAAKAALFGSSDANPFDDMPAFGAAQAAAQHSSQSHQQPQQQHPQAQHAHGDLVVPGHARQLSGGGESSSPTRSRPTSPHSQHSSRENVSRSGVHAMSTAEAEEGVQEITLIDPFENMPSFATSPAPQQQPKALTAEQQLAAFNAQFSPGVPAQAQQPLQPLQPQFASPKPLRKIQHTRSHSDSPGLPGSTLTSSPMGHARNMSDGNRALMGMPPSPVRTASSSMLPVNSNQAMLQPTQYGYAPSSPMQAQQMQAARTPQQPNYYGSQPRLS